MVADGVGVRLEQRAPQMRNSVAEAKPRNHASCAGVVDRRLLTEEVRHDGHAIGARGNVLRQAVEILVQAKAHGGGFCSRPAGQSGGKPVEARSTRRHASVGDVEARNQMIVEE
jgi:hypothetical protein